MFWRKRKEKVFEPWWVAQRLDLKDGDILVLMHPGHLSEGSIKRIKEDVLEILKKMDNKAHVMVLEEGMRFSVLGRAKDNQGDKPEPQE